jgi:hypothetical protein
MKIQRYCHSALAQPLHHAIIMEGEGDLFFDFGDLEERVEAIRRREERRWARRVLWANREALRRERRLEIEER